MCGTCARHPSVSRAVRGADGLLAAVVAFNGAYDIACCLAILVLRRGRLAAMHVSMFARAPCAAGDELWHRLLAYWILTYGTVRLAAGVGHNASVDVLCAASYAVEALAYAAETHCHRTVARHGNAVSAASMVLAVLTLGRALLRGRGALDACVEWGCFCAGLLLSAAALAYSASSVTPARRVDR